MKIGIVTGKRGGFDAMLPLMKCLEESSEHELVVFVVDQHTMPMFGHTDEEVEKALLTTPVIRIQAAEGDGPFVRSLNCARVLSTLPLETLDYMVVYGDRGESLAAAHAALIHGIPIIHLEAGETTGTIDDKTRWAISSLADICFAPTSLAAGALEERGISKYLISGDLHLDAYNNMVSFNSVADHLGYSPTEVAIVLFHPDPGDPDNENIDQAIRCLLELDHHIVAIYPCSDPGHQDIINILHGWDGDIEVYPNLPGPIFRTLLREADIIVGNSSAGIKEAPYVHTYAIDIGSRQKGREREYCTYHSNKGDILNLIESVTEHPITPDRLKYPYGKGDATGIVYRWINGQ